MSEQKKKLVVDTVHGCNLAADRNGSMIVAKFDLGHVVKTFLMPSLIAKYILEKAPVMEGGHVNWTTPEIEPKDWDGVFTPMMTSLSINEFDNEMALEIKLNRGDTDGLLFRSDAWSLFIKSLWQYYNILLSPHDASGTAH
jgi:hypothetical protein